MKTYRLLIRTSLFFLLAAVCAGLMPATARCQSVVPPGLVINLYVSDERIIIYAGSENGLQRGQRFSVLRNGAQIALIELVDVRAVSSIAKIISKLDNVRNMDQIVPAGSGFTRGGMKPEAPVVDYSDKKVKAPETPAPASTTAPAEKKADKEEKKPAEKKTEEKKPEKKPAAKPKAEKKDPEEEEEKPAEKKDTKSKKDDKKADAKKEVKEKKALLDPREPVFTTDNGASGLWTIPSTDIVPKGKAAFSWHHGWYSVSSSAFDNYRSTASGGYIDIDKSSVALTYGLDRNLELTAAKTTYDVEATRYYSSLSSDYLLRVSTSGDVNMIGLKYNPAGKRYFLEPSTKKKWTYAVGAQWWEYEDADKDASFTYGVMKFPEKKFDLTAGIFHYDTQDMIGKKLGTMAGVEIPLSRKLLLIGESSLFQSQYTYNFAFRYIVRDKNSLLVGMSDTTDMRFKEVGLSFTF